MDSDYQLDLSEVRRHLEETQVVGFFFPFIRKTLLLDMRSNNVDPPLVIVVPMVNSAEERLRSLRRLRPRFPRPESMTLIPWPKWVASLQRLGIWELIERRMVALGGEAMQGRVAEAFADLQREEHAQVRNAILGEGYQTLWERT
jgi:hypothetical protein